MPSFLDYIKNAYTFIITISGVIAFLALVIGGILYLTSAGEPEQLKKAKKQILAAFLGIILLLSSYLILKTINPQLISFSVPGLEEISLPLPETPPLVAVFPDILDKIKEIAERVKILSEEIERLAKEIKELTDKCDCGNTQSLCMCTGGDALASCQPRRCYAGPTPQPSPQASPSPQPVPQTGFHPCLDFKKIKADQEKIIALRFELLYYKNKALAEKEDLELEISELLDKKIDYYKKVIEIEEEEKVIEYLEEEKNKLEKEKEFKSNLAIKLKALADFIEEIKLPPLQLGVLPEKCLYDEKEYGVNNKCNAHCTGGCHDIRTGCQPAKCDGPNPCPVGEIQENLNAISEKRPSINQVCEEILALIKNIINLKTEYI